MSGEEKDTLMTITGIVAQADVIRADGTMFSQGAIDLMAAQLEEHRKARIKVKVQAGTIRNTVTDPAARRRQDQISGDTVELKFDVMPIDVVTPRGLLRCPKYISFTVPRKIFIEIVQEFAYRIADGSELSFDGELSFDLGKPNGETNG